MSPSFRDAGAGADSLATEDRGPQPLAPAVGRACASLFALALLGGTLLAPAARADIAATRGARSLGTTVNGGDSCASGSCRIGGGRSRGENLFQRLDRFDTRGGISDVLIENGSSKTVVMGVIGPGRTQITVPVSLQNRGGLMLMSPAGMTVSGAGSFLNVSRLGLTNQTGLRVGASTFDALSTTAQELEAPDYAAPIVFDRASLRTSLDSLDGIGLASPGSIEITGAQLVVARNLLSDLPAPPPPTVLIDAGLAPLSLSNAVIQASETVPTTALLAGLAGETSIAFYGSTISLTASRLEATGFGQTESGNQAAVFGRVNLQADGALNLTGSTLKGLKVGLRGTDVTLSDTTAAAPRGLIQVEASNRIALEGSTLNVAPQTPADVLGQGLGIVSRDLESGSVFVSSIPAQISLATNGTSGEGIRIRNSSLQANNLAIALLEGIPPESRNRQNMVAGNVFISASSGPLEILSGSRLSADADQDFGGLISLLALDPEFSLTLNSSTLSASSPNGSSDISLFGSGPINILSSTLEANTTSILATDGALNFFSNPPEIRISSASASGINIEDSTLTSRMSRPAGLNPEGSFTPYSAYQDLSVYDQGDGGSQYLGVLEFGDIPTGGLIRVTSAGPVSISARSLLDASSSSGLAGIIELIATGGNGISLDSSTAIATIDDTIADFPSSLHPGRIDLLANSGITLNNSSLDASFRATGIDSCSQPCGGSIQLLSGAGVDVNSSNLRASATSGAGGSIVLGTESGSISVEPTSTLDVSGAPPGSIEERQTTELLSSFTSGSGLYADQSLGWRLDRQQILNVELGTSENTSLAVQRLEIFRQSLTQGVADLVVDNRDPTKVRVKLIETNLSTTQAPAQPTDQTFDITTEAGLEGLKDFLRDRKIDTDVITAVEQTLVETVRQQRNSLQAALSGTSQSQSTASPLNVQESLSAASPSSDGETNASGRNNLLSAALALQAPLSEAQTSASLQEGEEASRDRLAEFMGAGTQAPPVPTLAQLQALLRQARSSSADGQEQQAAILRLSYAADPQATGSDEGSLDLVLLTGEGEPSGWRTTIRLSEFRELLRRYYSDLAEQNPAMGSSTPSADAAERKLFELLLRAPLQQLAQQRIGTLIISADPSLIDIPFNALHDGERYLSQRFSLAVTPSLAFTNLAAAAGARSSSGQRMNAGASLFNNGLTPLPMVEKELAELSSQQGQRQVTTLLNRDFNPTSFSSGFAAAGTRQVHIASHAEIAAGPQRVPTIYTGDTALSLRELGQLRQRSGAENLDLVTLSACRSALNGADLELGFAGLAVQLGAKTAIGTKWYVDDLATSSFFVLFYRQLQQGLAKADALRATQQAFAAGQVRVEGTRVIGPGNAVLLAQLPESYQHRYTRGFSHPYYWAGVQLVGSPW
jgi:CHAT domain-containing protein